MNIYKFLVGIVVTILFVVVLPYVAVQFGWMAPIKGKAWLILLITASGLIIKSVVGDIVAGEFAFYKFGYDNCVLTFGALLTALALQLVATIDLFPGVSNVSVLRSMPTLASDPIANRSTQLFILLVFALVGTLVTGRIAAAIKQGKAHGESFLALLNSIIGAFLLGLYVLVLITKG
ncbi:hypothetical protein [Paraburkholderia sp. MM5477-R1]|uniref:hypothetical protein n=1 Tax=Paraburkholderia sp. MM5477-R1 TaxID=2991062 RepID=UPI003D1A2EB8